MSHSVDSYADTSRFSRLPSDLRKIIILFVFISIFYFLVTLPIVVDGGFAVIVLIVPTFFALLAYGLYRLNETARKISLGILAISAFFSAFSLIKLMFGSFVLFLLIDTGSYLTAISWVAQSFFIPILTFYLLYLISNDGVKQYFHYPEMIEDSSSIKTDETKEYRSFGTALD